MIIDCIKDPNELIDKIGDRNFAITDCDDFKAEITDCEDEIKICIYTHGLIDCTEAAAALCELLNQEYVVK